MHTKIFLASLDQSYLERGFPNVEEPLLLPSINCSCCISCSLPNDDVPELSLEKSVPLPDIIVLFILDILPSNPELPVLFPFDGVDFSMIRAIFLFGDICILSTRSWSMYSFKSDHCISLPSADCIRINKCKYN